VEEDPFQQAGREGHPEDPSYQVGGHQLQGGKVDVLVKVVNVKVGEDDTRNRLTKARRPAITRRPEPRSGGCKVLGTKAKTTWRRTST
jgi:hypothetical protein